MRIPALAFLFLVLLAYGVFGWLHRRFTLRQVAVVAALTGLLVGVLAGLAAGADALLIVAFTSLFVLGFATVGTLFSYLNRRGLS
jgi:CHASE2 domain-containing sensor protein